MLCGGRPGKLRDWIRWQLSADGPGPGYCENACRWIRRRRKEAGADDPCAECPSPALLPENVPVIELFLGVDTQWRVGFGGPVGLDYQGVEAAARILGIDLEPGLFRGIQVIEREYLKAIADKAKREKSARPKERRPERRGHGGRR